MSKKLVLGIFIVVFSLFVIVFVLLWRDTTEAKIVKVSWKRTIEIENFLPRQMAGWDESVPADSYEVSCKRKHRRNERYVCGSHQECTSYGKNRSCHNETDFCTRSIYDDYCYYTVDRWETSRIVEAQANDKHPFWPDYELVHQEKYGNERKGPEHQSYYLKIMTDKNKTKTCKYGNQTIWDKYSVNDMLRVKTYITGGVDCGSIK